MRIGLIVCIFRSGASGLRPPWNLLGLPFLLALWCGVWSAGCAWFVGVQASDGLLWWAYEAGFLHGSGEQVWKPVSFLLVPLAFGMRFFRVLRGSLSLHGLPCVY